MDKELTDLKEGSIMDDDKKYSTRFNQMLREEMSRAFELKDIPIPSGYAVVKDSTIRMASGGKRQLSP